MTNIEKLAEPRLNRMFKRLHLFLLHTFLLGEQKKSMLITKKRSL